MALMPAQRLGLVCKAYALLAYAQMPCAAWQRNLCNYMLRMSKLAWPFQICINSAEIAPTHLQSPKE
jgi:hypothetical protein